MKFEYRINDFGSHTRTIVSIKLSELNDCEPIIDTGHIKPFAFN